jgi:hypothetical protein
MIAVRQAQWWAAEAGNVTMMIWLGKQYLGQTNQGPLPARKQTGPLAESGALGDASRRAPFLHRKQSLLGRAPARCRHQPAERGRDANGWRIAVLCTSLL